MNNDDALRYPIGKFAAKDLYTAEEIKANIDAIERLPADVAALVATLTAKQLDTPYRDGGWTARQVVHHIADSHMNAYIRLKWTLTENTPLIKAYNEADWAVTPETALDPALSLALLTALHAKWVALLRRVPAQDFNKQFLHPETNKHVRLDRQVATYAWHGAHHLGHLRIVAAK